MSTASTTSTPPVAKSSPVIATSARRRAAVIAGAATVTLSAIAIPANLVALQLAEAVAAGEGLTWFVTSAFAMRATVLAIVVAATLDVVIAWALTRFLDRPGHDLPQLAGWLRVTYAAAFLVAAGMLATGIDAADEATLAAASTSFASVWKIALVLFAAHLLVLGCVLLRAPDVPRVAGILVIAAGACYAAHGALQILVADLGMADGVLTALASITSIAGELGLAAWLLARGSRTPR